MKKHLNETKFASKISTSASILCTDIPASKIPSPENTILEHPRRKETSKRRVDRAEPIRQTANLPPHISSRTSTKIQFVENSRLLEEEGERYIYIDREYRFRATSIMEDSVQGSAIILQHPPLEPRPPRPLSSVIQSVYIYIYARYRSAAWRDGIPSPVNAGSLWKAFTIDAWPIVRLWDISIGGGYPHASKLRSRRGLLREAKPPII